MVEDILIELEENKKPSKVRFFPFFKKREIKNGKKLKKRNKYSLSLADSLHGNECNVPNSQKSEAQ